MNFAVCWILTLLIVSATILFGLYMYCCYEDGIKMFDDHSFEQKMIKKLEKRVKILEDKL